MDKDLRKITDYAIRERERAKYKDGSGTSKEYRNLVKEQSQMMDQIKRERGISMRDADSQLR
jgi:hypothetical protein